jgi:hypothetical protein
MLVGVESVVTLCVKVSFLETWAMLQDAKEFYAICLLVIEEVDEVVI